MIRPFHPSDEIPNHVQHYAGGKYWPFFRNCIGALDGKHISARFPLERQLAYRSGRDGRRCTQNVLAICDFDMRFTFVATGWEGTAHDVKVLAHAIYDTRNNFPLPPNDKYYLVDVGYPNRKGFLAPYKCTRYHVPDFRRVGARGRDGKFNMLHSSLRNVIERSFGLLKRRWSILNDMPSYSFPKQVKIVIAAMTVHNFFISERMQDDIYREFEDEMYQCQHGCEGTSDVVSNGSEDGLFESSSDSQSMGFTRDCIRDALAIYHNLP